MEINPPPYQIPEFTVTWRNWLNQVYEKLRGPLWEDMLAPLSNSQPRGTAPTLSVFGATSITQQYEFSRGDGVQVGFHVPHDVKPGSKMYPHVHWSTDGTAATSGVSDVVEWVIDYEYAKGHQQESFGNAGQIILTQSVYNSVTGSGPSPTAWHHYITEASDAQALTMPEVDSLILMKISRGSSSDTYTNLNGGHVFALFVDIHYQKDRLGTPGKTASGSGFYKY